MSLAELFAAARAGIGRPMLFTLLLMAWTPWAQAAVRAPIIGEVERITINDPNDVWSRGVIVVGGQNVILPRNLLIDLPANRLTLHQLLADAPGPCRATGESGLARGDRCRGGAAGAQATILANRTNGGDMIAGEVFIAKGVETVIGTVTFIDHTDGYFRVNGVQGDPNTGVMVRINDPTGRHTVQQGLGCSGPNCSPDTRFGLDPDNYTAAFITGYPICIPSTVTGGNRTTGADASGVGDPLCPDANRSVSPVPDSTRFAPLQVGDNVTAEGNFEDVGSVRFLSAHTMTVDVALQTRRDPTQPDYMTFDEVEWDVAGFQNQRARLLLIGFTTLPDSQLDVFSLHKDPVNNNDHPRPLASTVNNVGTINQGIAPNAGHIFKVNFDVDFVAGVNLEHSPCANLRNAGFTTACSTAVLDIAQNFRVLSPISREIRGITRHSATLNPGVVTLDVAGHEATNGQYLTPVGIGHPEFVEINLGAVQTPFIFAGEPWNLDRRLGPGGCDGACEATPQPLDPFPFSGLDPRTQAGTPGIPLGVRNRILSFFPFSASDVLAWPPVDPAPQGVVPAPPLNVTCGGFANLAPTAVNDSISTAVDVSVEIDVAANDIDFDGTLNRATVTLAGIPTVNGGTATVNPVTGVVTYTPPLGFTGTDSFTYTIQDDQAATSNVAGVTVSVGTGGGGGGGTTPPNDPPVATADLAATTAGNAAVIAVLANDADPDGTLNPASVQIVTAPTNGTATVNTATGEITFTPNAGFTGADSFTYTVQDNNGAVSNVVTVTVNVNTAPAGDTLTVTQAVFTVATGTWRISGTSTVPGPGNTVTIRLPGGTLVGRAAVDALGNWRFNRTGSTVDPRPGNRINLRSTAGGVLLRVPVTVR